MSPQPRNQNGFALAAALLAMVIVGALVTGGFVAASSEGRMGTGSRLAADAFYIADQGLDQLLGNWPADEYRVRMPAVGDTVFPLWQVPVQVAGETIGEYTVNVRRLTNELFYVQSTGRVAGRGMLDGAERRVGTVVRLFELSVPMDRAFQTWGDVVMQGNSLVSGADLSLAAWPDCTPQSDTMNAVIVRSGSRVRRGGSAEIVGDTTSAPFTTADFNEFGNITLDDLRHNANIRLPGGQTWHPAPAAAGGVCIASDSLNWGDPQGNVSACLGHLPIIHIQGDAKINAQSVGQGILIVDGDLELTGGFEFFGVVIVGGQLRTTGSGGHVNGITMAQNGGLLDDTEDNYVSGSAQVNYSSCAIERAVQSAGMNRGIPLAERSWIDLSAAGTGT